MTSNITPFVFNDVYSIDINDIKTFRPDFMTPKPVSNNEALPLVSLLGKRAFNDAFEEEEEQYGQKIGETFFETNIGHGVFSPVDQEKEEQEQDQDQEKQEQDQEKEQDHQEKEQWQKTNVDQANVQQAVDSVIQDFRLDFNNGLRRERDCESKYDVEEILAWCDYYLNNRNLFNV